MKSQTTLSSVQAVNQALSVLIVQDWRVSGKYVVLLPSKPPYASYFHVGPAGRFATHADVDCKMLVPPDSIASVRRRRSEPSAC
jgi:hypothetical protein